MKNGVMKWLRGREEGIRQTGVFVMLGLYEASCRQRGWTISELLCVAVGIISMVAMAVSQNDTMRGEGSAERGGRGVAFSSISGKKSWGRLIVEQQSAKEAWSEQACCLPGGARQRAANPRIPDISHPTDVPVSRHTTVKSCWRLRDAQTQLCCVLNANASKALENAGKLKFSRDNVSDVRIQGHKDLYCQPFTVPLILQQYMSPLKTKETVHCIDDANNNSSI